jgi:serine/threonine-protein kinase
MSPEQALGRDLDGRSDLFSAGVLLYELITRQPAFSGPSAAALALRITQQDPVPIAELAPHCPGGLRFIVDKLLAKRPERRFASGEELGKALERETKAYGAVQADQVARGRFIPVQVRVTIATVMIMAIALFFGINTVLARQYQAMEQMAFASGSSIAAFVASNAALPSVENAATPQEERDWLPIQAFITAAANDASVRWMTMIDADGVIRGSSDPKLLGKRYQTPVNETIVYRNGNVTVTDIRLRDGRAGYRFVHPILYAGKKFGMIEVSISKAGLEAAAERSRDLLMGLGALVVAIVGGLSFAIAKYLARPLRRVKSAMLDATMGNFDFRISHRRKDEFGRLFDTFNLFANAMQERLDAAERGFGGPRAMEATRINSPFEIEEPLVVPVAVGASCRARA